MQEEVAETRDRLGRAALVGVASRCRARWADAELALVAGMLDDRAHVLAVESKNQTLWRRRDSIVDALYFAPYENLLSHVDPEHWPTNHLLGRESHGEVALTLPFPAVGERSLPRPHI